MKELLSLFLSLLAAQPAFGMKFFTKATTQSFWQRLVYGKPAPTKFERFKEVVRPKVPLLNKLLAGGIALYPAYKLYNLGSEMAYSEESEVLIDEEVRKLYPLAVNFILKKLQEAGINAQDVSFLSWPSSSSSKASVKSLLWKTGFGASLAKIFCSDTESLDELEKVLKDERKFSIRSKLRSMGHWSFFNVKSTLTNKEYLDFAEAALWHEAGHMKNFDAEKGLVLNFGMRPLCFIAGLYGAIKLNGSLKIPAAMFFNLIPFMMNKWRGRVAESRADEHIKKNHRLLASASKQFGLLQKDRYALYDQKAQNASYAQRMLMPIKWHWREFVDLHPTDGARAQRFEERLKELEKDTT